MTEPQSPERPSIPIVSGIISTAEQTFGYSATKEKFVANTAKGRAVAAAFQFMAPLAYRIGSSVLRSDIGTRDLTPSEKLKLAAAGGVFLVESVFITGPFLLALSPQMNLLYNGAINVAGNMLNYGFDRIRERGKKEEETIKNIKSTPRKDIRQVKGILRNPDVITSDEITNVHTLRKYFVDRDIDGIISTCKAKESNMPTNVGLINPQMIYEDTAKVKNTSVIYVVGRSDALANFPVRYTDEAKTSKAHIAILVKYDENGYPSEFKIVNMTKDKPVSVIKDQTSGSTIQFQESAPVPINAIDMSRRANILTDGSGHYVWR